MLNFQAMRLMHRHDDKWVEMSPVAEQSADALDPERRLVHAARVYRCDTCDEEVRVEPAEASS